MINLNGKNGAPMAVEVDSDPPSAAQVLNSGPTANGLSIGGSTADAILQNNSLRKSMQGSTKGLRSF